MPFFPIFLFLCFIFRHADKSGRLLHAEAFSITPLPNVNRKHVQKLWPSKVHSPYYISNSALPPIRKLRLTLSSIPSNKKRRFLLKDYHFHNNNFQSKSQLFSASPPLEDLPESIRAISESTSEYQEATQNKPNSSITSKLEESSSYKTIVAFVSTTIIIWLSEPILSLVDTTVLGRFSSASSSSVIQLAALGPATMLIDSAIYLTYFLAIATTNQLAKSIAEKDNVAQQRTTSHALGVAIVLGVLITSIILGFGTPLLRLIIGDTGISASDSTLMLKEALSYCQIRCVAAPLSVMGLVAQSAALASLDTWTPFLAVLVSSITNIIGDLLLCVHPFQMGIEGAAIATAAASAMGSIVLLFATKKRVDKLKKPDTNSNTDEIIPFTSFPDGKSLWSLVKLAGPIFFVITIKLLCYSAMTIRATAFGVIPLACHNIMLRIFFFFSTFGDSLSQSAQTFLPKALYAKDNANKNINGQNDLSIRESLKVNHEPLLDDEIKKVEVKKHTTKLSSFTNIQKHFRIPKISLIRKNLSPLLAIFSRHMVLSAMIASFTCLASTRFLTTKSQFFTSDTTIATMMSTHAPWIGVALLLHPFIMVFEGSIIASRDLVFLVGLYGVTVSILFGQLKWMCNSFAGVWRSLFLFQSLRLILIGSRLFKKIIFNKEKKELKFE